MISAPVRTTLDSNPTTMLADKLSTPERKASTAAAGTSSGFKTTIGIKSTTSIAADSSESKASDEISDDDTSKEKDNERSKEIDDDSIEEISTIMSTKASVDPRLREAVSALTGQANSKVPDALLEELAEGDTSGLEALIKSMSTEPSKRDFEAFLELSVPLLSQKAQVEVEKMKKALIPLKDDAVDELETLAGQPIPANILRDLDDGKVDEPIQWLDRLDPQPSKDTVKEILSSKTVPETVKEALRQWADPPLKQSDAEKAVRKLSKVLDIPNDVRDKVSTGDTSALTDWMAEGPAMPTEQQWQAMDLDTLPRALSRELNSYKQAQDDLDEIGKLIRRLPSELPPSVTGPLLADQDTGPLEAWIGKNGLKPEAAKWDAFEGTVSPGVKDKMAEYKLRSCQGPFEGEWSQWSECPVTCGRGNRTRSRERTVPDCAEVENLFCHRPYCDVDCVWG